MKNLITGIHGFAGSHMADLLLERNEQVFGIVRSLADNQNIKHIEKKIQTFSCDIRKRQEVKKVLNEVRPDRIYHLASVSFIPDVEQAGSAAFETNLLGTLNLLESVKELKPDCRFLYVGSSEEYGMVSQEEGFIKEDRALKPFSLYGVSKAAADLLAQSYFTRDGLDVIRVRPYNHIGPRQDSRFVCSSFARQIAAIENGCEPLIKTGNLESYRDFTDVRDTVRAYHAVMDKAEAGEVFNVCSGKMTRVKVLLDTLLKISGVAIKTEVDPSLFREAKPVNVSGVNTLLQQRTGWRPQFSLDQTLGDLLNYWRAMMK